MISTQIVNQRRSRSPSVPQCPSYDASVRFKWQSPCDGHWAMRVLLWIFPMWHDSSVLELPFSPVSFMWLRYVITPQGSMLSHSDVWFEVES